MAPDVALAWPLKLVALLAASAGLAAFALYLRLRVFLGKQPGGVDTWYYLASAEALRRQKRLPIRLPQYLLHDAYESYPAGFPLLLALLPQAWLRRYFWLVGPTIDVAHLLLLLLLTFRLTDSVLAASTAGLIYAVTPQLISETRNLNGRAFASLLQTLAMLALLRSIIPSAGPTLALVGDSGLAPGGLALLVIALLYNTHTSTTIAFLVSAATLTLVSGDLRFVALGVLGLPLAIALSGGYYVRVIHNHLHAARFWFRNVRLRRAHQVNDSPAMSDGRATPEGAPAGASAPLAAVRRSLTARLRPWAASLVRLLGENPFVLPVLVMPVPPTEWARFMYWWAVAVLAWAFATTFIPPLRILGPGVHYMKLSVFPSAYALAVAVNVQEGALVRLTLLLAVIASLAALAYFYRYMATRRTEHNAETPPDLAAAAAYLRTLPGGNVLVLPNMYADYVAYAAGKAVVWGGHSGNLERFEEFFPVLRQPVGYFLHRYRVDYLVVDLAYTTLARIQAQDLVAPLAQYGSIAVCRVRSSRRGAGSVSTTVAAQA